MCLPPDTAGFDIEIKMRGCEYRVVPMLHDGRFYQIMRAHGGKTRISAVVFSLPQATVLMENPDATNPLPPNFRCSLLRAPHFRLDLSVIEWVAGLSQQCVDIAKIRTRAIAEALVALNPP